MCSANCRDPAHVWSGSDVIVIRHPYNIRTWSDFHSSVERTLLLLWFCIRLVIGVKKTRAIFSTNQKSKTKTNHDSLGHVFQRFASAACICFEFVFALDCLCPL